MKQLLQTHAPNAARLLLRPLREKVVKIFGIIGVVLLAGADIALADVTVAFPVAESTLRHLATLTLDFTVDSSGKVILDAKSSNRNAETQAIVNSWDGPAGSVADESLFNTRFTLVGVAKINGEVSRFLSIAPQARGPGLHVNDMNINHAGAEEIVWTYAGPDRIRIERVAYVGRVAHGDSNLTFLDCNSRKVYMLPNTSTSGVLDLENDEFTMINGQSFTITTDRYKRNGTTPRNQSAGASLDGLTFVIEPVPAAQKPVLTPVQIPSEKPTDKSVPACDTSLGFILS